MSLQVTSIPAFKDNYIWAITNNQHQVWVVDPGDAKPVEDYLSQHPVSLQGILVTHHHFDHMGGVAALVQRYSVPVFGPQTLPGVTHPMADLDSAALDFQVLTIPGHTLDHIAYVGHGILFCGDTLFSAGCGRVFEGTPAQMFHSLQRLAALHDGTQVYCGHEYTEANLKFAAQVERNNPKQLERIKRVQHLRKQGLPSLPSSIKIEKAVNPFLRCHEKEVIESVSAHVGRELTAPVEVFSVLRAWKNAISS